jgi:hypothetical protein
MLLKKDPPRTRFRWQRVNQECSQFAVSIFEPRENKKHWKCFFRGSQKAYSRIRTQTRPRKGFPFFASSSNLSLDSLGFVKGARCRTRIVVVMQISLASSKSSTGRIFRCSICIKRRPDLGECGWKVESGRRRGTSWTEHQSNFHPAHWEGFSLPPLPIGTTQSLMRRI